MLAYLRRFNSSRVFSCIRLVRILTSNVMTKTAFQNSRRLKDINRYTRTRTDPGKNTMNPIRNFLLYLPLCVFISFSYISNSSSLTYFTSPTIIFLSLPYIHSSPPVSSSPPHFNEDLHIRA